MHYDIGHFLCIANLLNCWVILSALIEFFLQRSSKAQESLFSESKSILLVCEKSFKAANVHLVVFCVNSYCVIASKLASQRLYLCIAYAIKRNSLNLFSLQSE